MRDNLVLFSASIPPPLFINYVYFFGSLIGFNWLILVSMCFRNIFGQLGAGVPHAVSVTPEERQAIERVSLTSYPLQALNECCQFSSLDLT